MISMIDNNATYTTKHSEGFCLSTDEKPTDWANGSILIEMDTSKIYVYDADNTQWRELNV